MKIRLIVIAAFLLFALSAYAHHPFAAEYDWTKPVTLTGSVSKLEWTNPHAYLHVDAKDQNGEMKHWTLELGSVGALTRAGWTSNTVKPGQQITVDAWLARSEKDKANAKSVKLPNGRELSAASSITDSTVTNAKSTSN